MNRRTIGWLVLPVGSMCLGGCHGGTTTGTASPRTAPPFLASDAGFSAVFPTTPRRQTLPVEQAGVSLSVILYEATTNHEQVAVASTSMPDATAGSAGQAGLDDTIDIAAGNVKGTVAARTNTTFLGQPAEDAVITAPGVVVHARVVYIGDKRFLLEGVTSSVATPHPQYDELLASFKAR